MRLPELSYIPLPTTSKTLSCIFIPRDKRSVRTVRADEDKAAPKYCVDSMK